MQTTRRIQLRKNFGALKPHDQPISINIVTFKYKTLLQPLLGFNTFDWLSHKTLSFEISMNLFFFFPFKGKWMLVNLEHHLDMQKFLEFSKQNIHLIFSNMSSIEQF